MDEQSGKPGTVETETEPVGTETVGTETVGPGGADGSDDLAEALRRVGDRWTLLVVDALRAAPLRYGEIESAVAGIAPNVLARRLRDLESDGLVVATPYQQRPVRMSYELSAAGAELADALEVLRHWGALQRGAGSGAHDACGTQLELRRWCPTCRRVVDGSHDDGGESLVRL